MRNITIPAAVNGNPGVYSENMSESGFSVVSTSASFTLQIGNAAQITVTNGQNFGAAAGKALGPLVFSNMTSTAISVTIGAYGTARDNPVQAVVSTFAANTTNEYDFGTTPNPTGVTFAGVDSSGRARQSIYITNFGVSAFGTASTNVLVVFLGVNSSGVAAIVPPQTTLRIDTNASVTISAFNATLGAAAAHQQGGVIEIFYSKALQTDT